MKEEIGSTQTEYVRTRMEQGIADGTLRPGERIDEERLASMFGTSRTPVREAVMQLVAAGLLEKRPRQGAIVAVMTMDQLLQAFDFAAELAASCAKFAARRLRGSELAALEQLHEQMGEARARGDYAAYTADAVKFHMTIVEGSKNRYLIESTLRMANQLAPYFRYELTVPGKIDEDHDDHRKLVDALRKRDSELASTLMLRHAMLAPDVIGDFLAFQAGDLPTDAEWHDA